MYRIPETIDFDAKRLISKILVIDPLKRPKASEIEQDRWVRAGKTTNSIKRIHKISGRRKTTHCS